MPSGNRGWRALTDSASWYRRAGRYPIPAYSEFMPPPRLGRKPCGEIDETLFARDDPFGWRVSAHEEEHELRPGLQHIAGELLHVVERLGRGDPAHGIAHNELRNNPFWPDELQQPGAPPHERFVLILPLALSRTQDDKGRIRWTLFGGSEEGPARPFWRGASDEAFVDRLLHEAYHDRDGLRVFDDSPELPKWAARRRWRVGDSLRGVRYVLTFEAFAKLPGVLRAAYRSGDIHLLPFPGSLVFFGAESYRGFPLAPQIPLLHSIARRESPGGIRVPQSGWLHEKTDAHPEPHPERGPFRQHFQRTHRWAKVHRDEDELDVTAPSLDKVARVLFSSAEDDLGLYGKPMARNAQIWTTDHQLLLDGPTASPEALLAARDRVCAGGTFGYRFFYPPMQVGRYPVFWHRPLVAFDGGVMFDAPAGHLAAPGVELWPRFEQRRAASPGRPGGLRARPTFTFDHTAKRDFERKYWSTIKRLAMGKFVNKDNADCVLDKVTQRRLKHHRRDLDRLGDYLIDYYGDAEPLPFRWKTDFPFEWSEGWRRNQEGHPIERDIIVRIAGRDRRRAVIMADHYDTAYMEDVFRYAKGGGGPRLAARGADDNHSATAALMLAAPIFRELSRQRKLDCDIWLVHLTGEEFPSDCLGARHLTQCIVERTIDVEIAGVYVLDMIAHNNDKHPDIFQIAPGEGRQSMGLADHALAAASLWNELAPLWNARSRRRGRGKRSKSGSLPRIAEHPRLHADLRPHTHPHSTLYNTDGQIFSDAGIPVVLFMENYDIDRHGYHDSHDTMENIDLDYGSAVAAIAIESVARAAAQVSS